MAMEIELGEFDLDSFAAASADKDAAAAEAGKDAPRQIILIIDASNSMQGYRIGAVNDCVNNILSKLKTLDRKQEMPVSVSAIGFSSRVFRWSDSFVRASDFKFSFIENADGTTDMNAVFQALIPLTDSMEKNAKKYVVLFTDGFITDDWAEGAAQWKQMEMYSDITKIAVAFDEDLRDPQSSGFLAEFADSGAVVSMADQEKLLAMLLS